MAPDRDLAARLGEGVRVYRQAQAANGVGRSPPQEKGDLLATLPGGRGGELRLVWLWEKDRSPVFSIRLWAAESDGELWPVRGVGVSIPAHQLPTLAEALIKALELAREHEETRAGTWGPRR
jgi:hypothetical protein